MYVPLRVHGHHSFFTGVDSPAALIARTRELGLSGMALADVDTLAGAVEYLQAAGACAGRSLGEVHGAPFRAIVAAEISDPSGEPGRLIALVESERGWANLCKLVSARQLGDDPGRVGARLDGPDSFRLIESAVRHREGLIFLADHPRLLIALHGRVDPRQLFAAVSPTALRTRSAHTKPGASSSQRGTRRDTHRDTHRNAHRDPAPPRMLDAQALRARTDDEQDALEAPKVPPPARAASAHDLVDAARAVGVATLAVPDVYAALPGGARDQRLRTAIKHNALLEDLPDAWCAQMPLHLLASAEMNALYADLPEVPGPFEFDSAKDGVPGCVRRTAGVAERCLFAPKLGGIVFPTIELDPGESPYSRLVALSFDGARKRYRPLKPEVVRRLDYELATIENLGFAPYFLLVKQIADDAKARGIPCVGRGSAADSLVAYCLALTDADPLRYRLIFERFLNPSRTDRPDIDLDFCWRRRDEVIEHVDTLFGRERTAMIATLNRCGLRSAFREAALVLGIPPVEVNRWSRRLPHFSVPRTDFDGSAHSRDELAEHEPEAVETLPPLPLEPDENPIAHAFRSTPEAEGFPFEDPRYQEALRAAAHLIDAPRHLGLHPGGVVVAPGSITDLVPCHRAAKGVITTQFDKDAVEAIGLVKIDLLGNRALTVIDDCVRALAERGIAIELETLPENDALTAALLGEGRTIGCFQVESPGMRNLLQQIGAHTMDDVIQAVALIRPGPAGSGMKDAYVRRFRKCEEPRPPHPRLADLLWDTQGVMLYQEDVMQVAARIAGMDLAEADLLRRALTKHRTKELGELRQRFIAGALAQGIEGAAAEHVWELVANFASFGFCKAHAVTYGRIAYRAVWLKAHFPAVYLASFLASDTGYYDARVYVEEARRAGVPILGPDVNKSQRTFAVEWLEGDVPALRIGLAQVKGLSERTLATLSAAREQRGPFVSLPDFLERTQAHTDEVESLIQAGAFADFDRTTPELLWRLALLRGPERRAPRAVPGDERAPLDPAELAACRRAPTRRASDAVREARARSGGWHANGMGLGNARIPPGVEAALFPEPETPTLALPRLSERSSLERGREEFRSLGLTVHAHPVTLFPCPAEERIAALAGKEAEPSSRCARHPLLRPVNPTPCGELARFEGARITLRGWPAATRHVRTRDGRSMRFLTLEDESGLAEVVLFPDVYEEDGAHLAQFGVLCVTGTVENQLGACTLHAERVW